MCPADMSVGTGQIKLETIGVINTEFGIVEYPACEKGVLGFSKKSTFLTNLPLNYHTIRIEVDSTDKSYSNKIELTLGNLYQRPEGSWVISSLGEEDWDMNLKSIQLGSLVLEDNATVIIDSIGKEIEVPLSIYDKLMSYFPTYQNCKKTDNNLLCLCESGIPANFPRFGLNFPNGEKLEILPQNYISIDSNICTLLLLPSNDNRWHINVRFYNNIIFFLNPENKTVVISKKEPSNNQSSGLISLPIPLILNCAVVLLLCIFASLIVIEVIKRISGLYELNSQNLRQYIMRRTLS